MNKHAESISSMQRENQTIRHQRSTYAISGGDSEDEVKELEHYSLQEKLDNEVKELDKRLEHHNKLRKVSRGTTSGASPSNSNQPETQNHHHLPQLGLDVASKGANLEAKDSHGENFEAPEKEMKKEE
ncbi:hypothetical protein L1987_12194 [Smallanthus sonchifolius]|uniref:Uncharacterized protein n=1 Tax=Smallanthus sonchifolius TaxID=185202 RepID=A0ACB9JFE4_9ASTR|nr:hypothetical protein L1987_12194 [Smallanthus sonchifolius]